MHTLIHDTIPIIIVIIGKVKLIIIATLFSTNNFYGQVCMQFFSMCVMQEVSYVATLALKVCSLIAVYISWQDKIMDHVQ